MTSKPTSANLILTATGLIPFVYYITWMKPPPTTRSGYKRTGPPIEDNNVIDDNDEIYPDASGQPFLDNLNVNTMYLHFVLLICLFICYLFALTINLIPQIVMP